MGIERNIRWKVLIALSILCLYGLFHIASRSLAAEESDTWAIPLGSKNEYQMTVRVTKDEIIQQGTHNAASTGIKYRTTGYYMTLDINEIEQPFRITNKAYVPVDANSKTEGNTKKTTYTISKEDFINAMIKLGVTSSKVKGEEGYISVYLHNEFEIYNGETDIAYSGYKNILGYQEMIAAGKRITGGVGWNSTGENPTTEILKSYYNYEYRVYPTLFSVNVVAVDDKENELGVLKTGDTGMFKEKYPNGSSYTAPESYSKGGVIYRARGDWYCQYVSRESNTSKKSGLNTGRTISKYSLPDAKKDTTVKLCMIYESSPMIVVNAVDEDTNQIIQSRMYSGTITAGDDFIRELNPVIIKNAVTYKKTAKYSYVYIRIRGGEEESVTKSGVSESASGPLQFRIPDNIKNGSELVVSVYYKKPIPGDIPITVLAVNNSNGAEISTLSMSTVKSGTKYEYTAPESVPSGTKTYTFTGKWDWQYKNSTTSSPIVKAGNGTKIQFDAPTADKVSGGITVKVYYDAGPPASEIRLRVIMVSASGATISEISEEEVTRNQKISKSIQASRSVNGVNFNYINKWEAIYDTSSGSRTISGTGTKASFDIPAATTMGSTVVLKIFYNATQEVEVPVASGPISAALDSPAPYGVINGDRYNGSYFTSEEGISTTESQYVFVKTKDYLLGYTLVNRTGKAEFNVPVTKYYTLEYMTATPASAGGPKPVTEVVSDKQMIRVEKAYSYWEISNLDYYYVNSANVYNYSLPGGGVSLNANSAYLSIPSLDTWHSGSVEDHVQPPAEVISGIELYAESPITSETSDRPSIEYEDLTSYAISMTGEAVVKNDLLIFNGGVVLSNTPVNKIAPSPNASYLRQSDTIIHDKVLFKEGLVIDAIKDNGSYSSSGNVSYILHPESVNASYSSRGFAVDVNGVIIHTPVICDPIMTADNAQWSQVINPAAGAVQIVLDQDNTLNDFTIRISNTLQHGTRLGYTIRDFSRSFIDPAYTSYIARKDGIVRNEMKLPFDAYRDVGMDGNKENDEFIKGGTWFVLGRDTHRFYVPMWVQEGVYTGEFRTVAVNGTDKLNRTEVTRNASRNNYVATQTINFQVTGRIYGLTLYDISDYPNWETVFRKKNSMLLKCFENATDGTKRTGYHDDYAYNYTVGTRNQYGKETERLNKYTIPLVNGSHPKYKNLGVLKTGYAVRFMLETTGEMYSSANFIKITPTFYYVDANGGNRRRVDLYYNEEINGSFKRLVKVGDGLDQVNIKSSTTGNVYTRIPEVELKNTAKIQNTSYSKLINQTSTMYSYNQIRILHPFRTFVGWNYASAIAALDSFEAVRSSTGQTELNLSKYTQKWYGTYKIPQNVYAVAAGYDVRDYLSKHGIDFKEDFWLTGGYIIVNFNIVTIDKNGKENLSYINANNYLNTGNCSMWVTEGANVQKTDSKGSIFNLKAGDSIIYYTDKKYSDDYQGKLY